MMNCHKDKNLLPNYIEKDRLIHIKTTKLDIVRLMK